MRETSSLEILAESSAKGVAAMVSGGLPPGYDPDWAKASQSREAIRQRGSYGSTNFVMGVLQLIVVGPFWLAGKLIRRVRGS